MFNVKEDIRDQREYEKEMKCWGKLDPGDRLAGWLLKIGPKCLSAKCLDGLLVLREDALKKPGFFPPYDDCCREATCECDILPVFVSDVPAGTRVAERVDGDKPSKKRPAGPQRPARANPISKSSP